jgi:hypothetical protein
MKSRRPDDPTTSRKSPTPTSQGNIGGTPVVASVAPELTPESDASVVAEGVADPPALLATEAGGNVVVVVEDMGDVAVVVVVVVLVAVELGDVKVTATLSPVSGTLSVVSVAV